MLVRALYRAAVVETAAPPYNTVTAKVFYPALPPEDPAARETGIFPADTRRAPFPVMLFFPGVNCDSAMYAWLAQEVAAEGVVVVLMTWVAQNLAGRVSLTPGIDVQRVTPQHYGTGFTASGMPALLDIVRGLNASGVLAGLLDVNRLILAGHSAGGTLALQNADKRYLPHAAGAIAYMANPLATTALGGFPPGVLPPLPGDAPTLMVGGSEDGIGTQHNTQFGRVGQSGADTVLATFREAFPRTQGDSLCVILRGANHYTPCFPLDTTAGRAFLDTPETASGEALRQALRAVTQAFIAALVLKNEDPRQRLQALLSGESFIVTRK